jgi:hypothetical protein
LCFTSLFTVLAISLSKEDANFAELPPSLNFLTITGEFCEGQILTASYGYIGGHEGNSLYGWYVHEVGVVFSWLLFMLIINKYI